MSIAEAGDLGSSNMDGTYYGWNSPLPISLMKSSFIVADLNIMCGPLTEGRLRKAGMYILVAGGSTQTALPGILASVLA